MGEDIYKTPESALTSDAEAMNADGQFYVVSHRKFLLLYFFTLGLYSIYWFYKNWWYYKKSTGQPMWPVMRGIFAIFFTHSLFNKVQTSLKEQSLLYSWAPGVLATTFVVASIVANVSDRLATRNIGNPVTDFLSLLLLVVAGWSLFKAQGAINTASNDIEGTSNANITPANIVWIILGMLLWALVGLGIYVTFMGEM